MDLGHLIGKFAKAEADEMLMHDDVNAFGAPSECHDDVSKSFAKESKGLENCYGSFDDLMDLVDARGLNSTKCFEKCVDNIYNKYRW